MASKGKGNGAGFGAAAKRQKKHLALIKHLNRVRNLNGCTAAKSDKS